MIIQHKSPTTLALVAALWILAFADANKKATTVAGGHMQHLCPVHAAIAGLLKNNNVLHLALMNVMN